MADLIAIQSPPFQEDVVALLERTLEAARQGEVIEVMMLVTYRNGDIGSNWTGCNDLVLLSGHAARLQHNIQRRIDGTV